MTAYAPSYPGADELPRCGGATRPHGGNSARTLDAEGIGRERWRSAIISGSLGRLSACRNPGLRVRHMHNPPVAEILQPFSPKEVG